MRLCSLHPHYLDRKGLSALWREALLAKKVLAGKTLGYTHHPQLIRFRQLEKPMDAIHLYLSHIYKEAASRGYRFDRSKIEWEFIPVLVPLHIGQLKYEASHLLGKLKARDPGKYHELLSEKEILPHPLFRIVEGGIEKWERI